MNEQMVTHTFPENAKFEEVEERLLKELSSDEKLIWQGRPQKWPYILALYWWWMHLVALLILATGPFRNPGGIDKGHYAIVIPLLAVYSGILVYRAFSYKNKIYAYTGRRLLYSSGWLCKRFEYLEYSEFCGLSAESNWLERLFGSSTILIETIMVDSEKDKIIYRWEAPEEACDICKQINEDLRDVMRENRMGPRITEAEALVKRAQALAERINQMGKDIDKLIRKNRRQGR
jgi:hypothetical protein